MTLLKNSPVSECKVSDVLQKTFWKPASDTGYQEKLKKFYVLARVWSRGKALRFCSVSEGSMIFFPFFFKSAVPMHQNLAAL